MAKDCHLRILKEKRVYLVGHLDLTRTLILDQLVQDGVLSRDQLKAMTDRCDTNLRLASELVRHLEHRPKDDWDTFLRCLKNHNHGHVVKHISRNIDEVPDDGVFDLTQLIAATMLEHFNKISVWTLHSDHITVPMDARFVDLKLVKDKNCRNDTVNPLGSYKDILRKSTGRSSIYLTGEPGAGKSTLTKRMCVEWATLIKKDNSTTPPGDIMGNYQLVLALFLRAVQPGDTFCQVIANEYQLREHEAVTLCRSIENTQKPVLIIVDGLDEYDKSTSKEITEIIHRKRLQHVTLFITSRRPPESVFASDDPGPGIQVILKGFSEDGTREYITKFFDKNKEEGKALLHEIKQSENLVHLSHIPAVLLMMATLWEETHHLASTLTGFYEEYVAFVFARFEKKLKLHKSERATSKTDLLKKYHAKVMDLGQLAESAKTIPLKLNFHHEDVIKYINQDDIRIGFLLEKQTFSGEIHYMYTHKTVQEFFYANYVVHSDTVTRKYCLKQLCLRGVGDWYMIRRFIIGLGGEDILVLLNTLMEETGYVDMAVATTKTEAQLEYLAEFENARCALPSEVSLTLRDRYPLTHYVKYICQNGENLKKMWFAAKDRNWRLLHHLHAPRLTTLHLWTEFREPYYVDIKQTLDITLRRFPLQYLSIGTVEISEELTAILKAVAESLNLRTFCFDNINFNKEQVNTLTKWLCTSGLEYLCMEEMQRGLMTKVIAFIPKTLNKLHIKNGCLHGLASMQEHLSVISQSYLFSLRMSECHLNQRDMLAVLCALPPSLYELDLSKNDFCGLANRDMPAIYRSLRKRRRVEDLSSLSTSNLQLLDLSGCNLTPQDIIAVIRWLPDTLTDLNMSGNCQEESDSLTSLIDMAKQLKTVRHLNLSRVCSPTHTIKTIKQRLAVTCPQLSLKWLDTNSDDVTDSDDDTSSDDGKESVLSSYSESCDTIPLGTKISEDQYMDLDTERVCWCVCQ